MTLNVKEEKITRGYHSVTDSEKWGIESVEQKHGSWKWKDKKDRTI